MSRHDDPGYDAYIEEQAATANDDAAMAASAAAHADAEAEVDAASAAPTGETVESVVLETLRKIRHALVIRSSPYENVRAKIHGILDVAEQRIAGLTSATAGRTRPQGPEREALVAALRASQHCSCHPIFKIRGLTEPGCAQHEPDWEGAADAVLALWRPAPAPPRGDAGER